MNITTNSNKSNINDKKVSTNNSNYEEFAEAMSMLGFENTNNFKGDHIFEFDEQLDDFTHLYAIAFYFENEHITVKYYKDGNLLNPAPEIWSTNYPVSEIVKSIENWFNTYGYSKISATTLLFDCSNSVKQSIITAAINTRDITKNMVRVKSSNIWSYGINIRKNGDAVGDVLAQFKGKNGGPDDIYIYYDVPVRLYRRWHTASSKGHFFWQYIRNNYKYSKLTGDKKGKLKNAINH